MLYKKVYKIYWELCLGQGFGFSRGYVKDVFETEEQAQKYIEKRREDVNDWREYEIIEDFISITE